MHDSVSSVMILTANCSWFQVFFGCQMLFAQSSNNMSKNYHKLQLAEKHKSYIESDLQTFAHFQARQVVVLTKF